MMRRLVMLGAAALVLFSCALPTNSIHRYALVYGVAYYGLQNLAYTALDADSMAQLFRDVGFDSVTERTSATDTNEYLNGALAPGEGPTRDNMIADVASAAAAMGPDDLLVFYFSGHGDQTISNGETREWIIPLGGTTPSIESASIDVEELGDMLAAISSPRKVVILDSCNSGGFAGSVLETDRTMPDDTYSMPIITPSVIAAAISNYFSFPSVSNGGINPYGNAMVIAGCGRDAHTFDASIYNHGALTHFLLGIRDYGDLNGDGAVTVIEAFSLTKAGVDEEWNKEFPESRFEPHVSGGPVDFVMF